jgi:hypothetical protein
MAKRRLNGVDKIASGPYQQRSFWLANGEVVKAHKEAAEFAGCLERNGKGGLYAASFSTSS